MKLLKKISICFFMIMLCNTAWSQDSLRLEQVQKSYKKIKKAVSSNNEADLALEYLNLGTQYFNQSNYAKSEEYLQKSKVIFTKLNDDKNIAITTRKLAQTQEKLNKPIAAANNYEAASKLGYSQLEGKMNSNDATRLRSVNLEEKEKAIQQNIDINSSQKKDELATDYKNMAEVQIQQNNIPKATENLENAYEISKEKQPVQAVEINQQIADLYVDSKNFKKAIEVKEKLIKEDFVQKDTKEKVAQIQELADIYLKSDDKNEAILLLQNAYKIAIEKGHTLEAQKSVLKLDSLYKSENKTSESIVLYKDFLQKLPVVLGKDQSLVDETIMKETEDKIAQLEKEKSLHDQLMKRKNLFNYLLLAGLLLAVGFIVFALYTQKKLKNQNKKIELQSLRREMNPHFIFNSLNSVNQFIAQNNELEANQYLTKFSKLMRGVMENSKEDFIPFHEELELLKNYLSLEKSRFSDKFDYEISVDENLNSQNLQIPGMLIQPFLENAIWHGLRYKTEKGFLKLQFLKFDKKIVVQIEDNGIGIEESKKQKTEHQKNRNGRGMKNTLERIQLLNDLYGKNIVCKVQDKENATGVLVVLKMDLS